MGWLMICLLGCIVCAIQGSEYDGDDRILAIVTRMLERQESVYNKRIAKLETQVMLQNGRIKALEAREKRQMKILNGLAKCINEWTNCDEPGTMNDESSSRRPQQGSEHVKPTVTSSMSTHDSHGPTLQSMAAGIRTGSIRLDTTRIGARAAGPPANVAFSAYLSTSIDHMALGHTVKFDKTHLNDGNGYNTYTGVFTVPVTGVYMFSFHWNTANPRYTVLELMKNGVQMAAAKLFVNAQYVSGEVTAGQTVVVQASAGEAVWVEDKLSADGNIFIHDGAQFATFCGFLIY